MGFIESLGQSASTTTVVETVATSLDEGVKTSAAKRYQSVCPARPELMKGVFDFLRPRHGNRDTAGSPMLLTQQELLPSSSCSRASTPWTTRASTASPSDEGSFLTSHSDRRPA